MKFLSLFYSVGLLASVASPTLYSMALSEPMSNISGPEQQGPVDVLSVAQELSRVSRRGPNAQKEVLKDTAIRQLITRYIVDPQAWSFCKKARAVIHSNWNFSRYITFPTRLAAASRDRRYIALEAGPYAIAIINMQEGFIQGIVNVPKKMQDFALRKGIKSLSFSKDSQFVIAATDCHNRYILQWNVNDLHVDPIQLDNYDFKGHKSDVSPDQRYRIGTTPVILDTHSGYSISLPIPPERNNSDRPHAMQKPIFSPDGQYIAAQSWAEGRILLLWNKRDFAAQPIIFYSGSYHQPLFSPDATCLLTTEQNCNGKTDLVCWNLKKIEKRQIALNNLMKFLFAALVSDKAARRNIRKILEEDYTDLPHGGRPFHSIQLITALHSGNLQKAMNIARAAYDGSWAVGTDFTFDDFINNINHQNTVFSIAALDECEFLDTPAQGNLAEQVQEVQEADRLTVELNAQAYLGE